MAGCPPDTVIAIRGMILPALSARRALVVMLDDETQADTSVGPTLVADGAWGAETSRALQHVLGVTADGDFGPKSATALQAKLGVIADGDFGPSSAAALQHSLGESPDGVITPHTVSVLQARLNAGTF